MCNCTIARKNISDEGLSAPRSNAVTKREDFFFFLKECRTGSRLFPKWQTFHPSVGCTSRLLAAKVLKVTSYVHAHTSHQIRATFCFETNDVLLTVWQLVVYSKPFDSDASIRGGFGRKLVPVTHCLITVNMHFLPNKREKSIMWELEEWASPLVQALVCWMTSELGQVWLIASLVSFWQLILSRKRLRMQMVFVKDACECVDVFFCCGICVKQAETSFPFTLLLAKNLRRCRLSWTTATCHLDCGHDCILCLSFFQPADSQDDAEGSEKHLHDGHNYLPSRAPLHGLLIVKQSQVGADRANHRLNEPVAKTMKVKRNDRVKMRRCGRKIEPMSKGHQEVNGFCYLATYHYVYNISPLKQAYMLTRTWSHFFFFFFFTIFIILFLFFSSFELNLQIIFSCSLMPLKAE